MMLQRTARTVENVRLADRTFRIRLDCPEVAAAIRPGQFVMLRLAGASDPLLGRPFALYDTVLDGNTPTGIDVVCLAGGIGQTPFLAYARELLGTRGYGGDAARPRAKRVSLYYGVRTATLA